MSVAHCLAGMFPPMNEQIWNDSLMWQAIPIHTIPGELDYVLGGKAPCPLYARAFDEYEQSDEVQLILKNNQSLIEYLEMYVGEEVRTICKVRTIYQALWVENLKNFPLPKWTANVFYPDGDMNKIANYCLKMRTNTKLLSRLKSGFFIREIFERFTMKMNNTLTPNRSLWIYSAHDTTIANILNSLGLFEVDCYLLFVLFDEVNFHSNNPQFSLYIFICRTYKHLSMHHQYLLNFINSKANFT